MTTFAQELANRATSLRLEAMPAETFHIARRAMADTIGVALAGAGAPFIDALETVLEPDPARAQAGLWGRGQRGSVLHAALINGTAAHALDFDDCSTTMGGHPSAPILPAVLALAEARDLPVGQAVEAYVTGFEVETRLARGLLPWHYEKGWHPTATLGVFGAAAASARLSGFDAERMTTTLAVAISMASGLKSNFGTPVKPLHVGQAAHNGLLAALVTERGMTANPAAFEHNYGFFNLFNAPNGPSEEKTYSPEAVLADWDGMPEILSPGIAIKQHPCCGSAHSAIDAALKLVAKHGLFAPEAIATIETWTHQRRLAHTNRHDPKTGLDAKFSVQFLTAKALTSGQIRLADFNGVFRTPDIEMLLPRVTAHAHDEADQYRGRVRVTLANGDVLEDEASTNFGRGPLNPMSDEELCRKFVDCAEPLLGTRAADVFGDILALKPQDSLRPVLSVISDAKGRQ